MEANAGKSFQMQIIFNTFPRISLLYCKLVLVQYWEYEYGLFTKSRLGDELSKSDVITHRGDSLKLLPKS